MGKKVKLVSPIFSMVLITTGNPRTWFLSTSSGFIPISGLRIPIHSRCEQICYDLILAVFYKLSLGFCTYAHNNRLSRDISHSFLALEV